MTIEELEKERERVQKASEYVNAITLMQKSIKTIISEQKIVIEMFGETLHVSHMQDRQHYTISHTIKNGGIRLKQNLVDCFNECIAQLEKALEAL